MRSITCIALIAAAIQFISCNENKNDSANNRQKAIDEIKMAEADFAKMVAEKGVAEAFSFYADSNAVIHRQNDTIIHGKEAIRNYYSTPFYSQALATWSPDFVDASEKGDLGYTYGKYTWQSTDTTGNVSERKGVFHTVWKKQKDGSWRYVWD